MNAVLCKHATRADRCAIGRRRGHVAVTAGMGDFFKGLLDFGSWAPRSTKIWRLNQYAYTEGDLISNSSRAESAVDVLEAQLREARLGGGAAPTISDRIGDGDITARSFTNTDDSEISAALGHRLSQVVQLEQEEEPGLTGQELRELIVTKYGKTHDVSIVRRDIPGKTLVSLNIMWNHLEQRSFKLTEAQYCDKLESVAHVINCVGQATRVRTFMRAPARAERGLPARPVVGTAVSIRLDLDDVVIREWFGAGYQ